jgi:hypothetical protein
MRVRRQTAGEVDAPAIEQLTAADASSRGRAPKA